MNDSDTLDIVHGDSMLQNFDLAPRPGPTLVGWLQPTCGAVGEKLRRRVRSVGIEAATR